MSAARTLNDRFSHASACAQSEFELGLLVSEVIDGELDAEYVRRMFSDLVVQAVPDDGEPQTLLNWFLQAGFGDPKQVNAGLQLSNLQWVMEHRQGIPISLAVLLIEGARRCGFSAHGVNYPGHFLVSIEGQLIDPLRMQLVDTAQLPGAVQAARDVPELMLPASPKMLGLRMLNNVKAYHIGRRDWTRALDMIAYQLAITATDKALSATLYFERGEFWEQLGAYAAAAEAYLRCAETCADKTLAAKAKARTAGLSQRPETLH